MPIFLSSENFDGSNLDSRFHGRTLLVAMWWIWNWKSAVLSVMLRVPVFLAVTIRHGITAIAGAVLLEAGICAFNAGWYAGVVQILRNRKPVWLVATVITVVLPIAGQILEYTAHVWHRTPHRVVAVIVSSVLGAISSLFNWYAMKQGALLTGSEQSSFGSDLRRIPLLIYRFLLLGPRWIGRRIGWMALPSH
jgi:hypothetical protein